MTNDKQQEYVTRNSLLGMLSEAENARVSAAESVRLQPGEEYLDLEHLDQGVRLATTSTPAGNMLPRRALNEDTWRKVLTQLAAPRIAKAYASQ